MRRSAGRTGHGSVRLFVAVGHEERPYALSGLAALGALDGRDDTGFSGVEVHLQAVTTHDVVIARQHDRTSQRYSTSDDIVDALVTLRRLLRRRQEDTTAGFDPAPRRRQASAPTPKSPQPSSAVEVGSGATLRSSSQNETYEYGASSPGAPTEMFGATRLSVPVSVPRAVFSVRPSK